MNAIGKWDQKNYINDKKKLKNIYNRQIRQTEKGKKILENNINNKYNQIELQKKN